MLKKTFSEQTGKNREARMRTIIEEINRDKFYAKLERVISWISFAAFVVFVIYFIVEYFKATAKI